MARNVRDALCYALKQLVKDDLKTFRNTLNDWEIEEGYRRIPRGMLQDKDAEDVVDLIRDYYTLSYGAQLTVEVLKAINQRQVALELQEDLDKVNGPRCQGGSKAAASASEVAGPRCQGGGKAAASASEGQKPFVDRHREELIKRVHLVDPILDGLLQQGLLKYEAYNLIRAQNTSENQMRELFQALNGLGPEDKKKVYDLLKEHYAPLIRDLESS